MPVYVTETQLKASYMILAKCDTATLIPQAANHFKTFYPSFGYSRAAMHWIEDNIASLCDAIKGHNRQDKGWLEWDVWLEWGVSSRWHFIVPHQWGLRLAGSICQPGPSHWPLYHAGLFHLLYFACQALSAAAHKPSHSPETPVGIRPWSANIFMGQPSTLHKVCSNGEWRKQITPWKARNTSSL